MTIQTKARARCHWLPDLDAAAAPLYQALVERLAADIAAGTLAPGERLPPQRLLADALKVTVGTITRAYREAERRGLVEAKVGSGTRVRSLASDAPSFHHLSQATDGSVDLSLSVPIPHPMRAQQLAAVMERLAHRPGAIDAALAYHPEQGSQTSRERLADWLTEQGLPMAADELILTSGGQHADYLALQALVQPGEAVASAAMTYPGMIAAARQLGLKHLAVPMDDQGILPQALERLCLQQKIRLLYLMPEHNNPTGARMGQARREAIVEIARRHDLLLVEDGVQFVTAERRGVPLYRLAPERSLYIFSVSKLLAGGLRMGAIHAPANLMSRLAAALRAQYWATPELMASAAVEWLTSPEAKTLIDWQWQEVAERQQLLAERLKGHEISAHPCSFYAWLTLPEPWRAVDFVARAAERGVTVIGADPFCVGSQPAPQAVRICVTPPAERAQLDEGLTRLAALLDEEPRRDSPLV
ncbi:DNA-binding transcriptional regulator, MocR family, contains an aminotransferase domain [Onishia taeanensis]|uniref:DNA-binding transcriptional regulator, MocR family, contains an aminotransferase domain n=1 Tax=Onishia taeanensis TaxID=284577 RepID=A0A1G7U999_9GAMM|nr:PLP-dependent aminotransferase family protein [Halomonas taeanensis]SDG43994.1 DNA-binding transcriptional regulator, MocR family, contains an aminotransferase domain [Halomonas taeanensis]